MKIGRHKMHNHFPMPLLRYWKPKRLTLRTNPPVYKWLWWYFIPKREVITFWDDDPSELFLTWRQGLQTEWDIEQKISQKFDFRKMRTRFKMKLKKEWNEQ